MLHDPLNPIPLEVPVIVSHKNGMPCLELRRNTTKSDLIKMVVLACINEYEIVILPKFNNKIHSINSLLEKGILYRDSDNSFKFLI